MRINGSIIGSNVTPSFLSGATGIWSTQNVELANRQIIWPTNIVTNGLVLFLDANNTNSYPGSGTSWYDLSGNGNTGTLTNGPTFNSANGGSIVFDGIDDYVRISHNSILAPTSQISYGAWAFLSNWNITNNLRLLSKTETGGYNIGLNESTIGAGNFGGIIYLGGAYRQAKVTRSTISSGWHYIIMTCDGRYFRLYIDAINVATYDHGSVATISYTYNNSFFIGAEPGPSTTPDGSYWNGNISQATVYNRSLTATEVLQNFQVTRDRFGV